MSARSFTILEQFDNEAGDFDSLGDIRDKLAIEIGEFLIIFSGLEHTINIVVSDMVSDRSHDTGYRILTALSMKNKIEFLYSILLQFISVTYQDKKKKLINLKSRLDSINSFRNKVVHANWLTLKKNGEVRTKIMTDNLDGGIKFENVTITKKVLKEAIKEAYSLNNEIDEFFMEAKNAAL
jgi:hypothetical protein